MQNEIGLHMPITNKLRFALKDILSDLEKANLEIRNGRIVPTDYAITKAIKKVKAILEE